MQVEKLTVEMTSFDGSRQVISNFSASFNKGINVIYGPPASGKTTLLQTLAGMNRPASGEIRNQGRLSLVSQVPEREFLHSSCACELGADNPEDVKKLSEELKEIGLNISIMERSPWSLSRGEKKRLALLRAAREYRNCEKVLIIDDPFCDLDKNGCAQVAQILKDSSNNVVIVATNRREDLEFLKGKGLEYSLIEI